MTMYSRVLLRPLVAALMMLCAMSSAHVVWTQVNQSDADAIAVYHLNDSVFTVGSALAVAPDWSTSRSLTIQAVTGPAPGFTSSANVPDTFFGTSLRMDGAQRADSAKNFGYDDPAYVGADLNGALPGDNNFGPDLVDKDVTIGFWLKWDAAPSASSIEIGFRSGSKLRITRDTVTPANDQFAVVATHGTTVSAPGFTNWDVLGTEEAPLDEWIHLSVTIDSTGSTYDSLSGHWRYNADTVGRFYLNGHPVGVAPHTAAFDGLLDFHSESSLLTIRNISGAVTIDEVAIWGTDLSVGGTAAAPFANGIGSGASSVDDWMSY
jgi:hypothetical protein